MTNFKALLRLMLLGVLLLVGCSSRPQHWLLTDVSGHLPDLKFSLTSDQGHPVTDEDYRGDVVMLYFGYTHCPDVCPITMARLAAVMQHLGKGADQVRILFVSVDPARDTPALLHAYVTAFDPHAVGLTGTDGMIATVARRYRVAYEPEKPNADGSYDVTHSSAVYIFDKDGRAHLLATPTDSIDAITHDVRQLLQSNA
ncbi:MAG: SCO family protein [Burkholderiaceae bacterium]|nr:MAG: SCO family protein [Burkholderiaceae bacterium]